VTNRLELDEALSNQSIIVGVEFEYISDLLEGYVGDTALTNDHDEAVFAHEEWITAYEAYCDKLEALDKKIAATDDPKKIKRLEKKATTLYPVPSTIYTDYMQMCKTEWGEGEGWDENQLKLLYMTGSLPYPPDPADVFGADLGDEDEWKELVRNNKAKLFGRFPLGHNIIRIVGYHAVRQKEGDKYWKAEYDTSIAEDGGIEIISPPIPIVQWVDLCPKVLKWIDRVGETTENTGFHIHFGLKGVTDLSGILDPMKLILFVDEGYVWKHFDERKLSTYCADTRGEL
jgi:hypothetical protein